MKKILVVVGVAFIGVVIAMSWVFSDRNLMIGEGGGRDSTPNGHEGARDVDSASELPASSSPRVELLRSAQRTNPPAKDVQVASAESNLPGRVTRQMVLNSFKFYTGLRSAEMRQFHDNDAVLTRVWAVKIKMDPELSRVHQLCENEIAKAIDHLEKRGLYTVLPRNSALKAPRPGYTVRSRSGGLAGSDKMHVFHIPDGLNAELFAIRSEQESLYKIIKWDMMEIVAPYVKKN